MEGSFLYDQGGTYGVNSVFVPHSEQIVIKPFISFFSYEFGDEPKSKRPYPHLKEIRPSFGG